MFVHTIAEESTMSDSIPYSIGLIVFAGVLMGAFTLPMKFAKAWPWEAMWLVYSISGLLVLPVTVALATLPSLPEIYSSSSASALSAAALFGFGWGIGSVLFGIGISRLGMSLGFTIILGLTAALGSLIPMLVLSPREIFSLRGGLVLAGLGIVLVGIYLCGVASGLKERGSGSKSAASDSELRTGIAICIFSGIFASMLNLAMAFGQDIARRAIDLGATTSHASNAIWVIAVACGAIANTGYCIFLLVRNRTASVFRGRGTASHWLLGAMMGSLWFGGVTVYGGGSASLGRWGAVLGWPLLMAVMIITANVLGRFTGEWRDAPRKANRTMLAGVGVLSIGVFVVSYSGTV